MSPGQWAIFIGVLCLGSLLKGAAGLGLPTVAIPVLALFVGVEHAIAVLAIPTVIGNGWMAWSNRHAITETQSLGVGLVATAVGGAIGAYVLTSISERLVAATLIVLVLSWVVLRLRRPSFVLARRSVRMASGPVGLFAGLVQGTTGLSGPVVGSWAQASTGTRDAFVLTASLFFQVSSLTQAVTLAGLGALAGDRLFQGMVATVLSLALLPVGQRIGRAMPGARFDKLVLVLLVASAVTLGVEAFG